MYEERELYAVHDSRLLLLLDIGVSCDYAFRFVSHPTIVINVYATVVYNSTGHKSAYIVDNCRCGNTQLFDFESAKCSLSPLKANHDQNSYPRDSVVLHLVTLLNLEYPLHLLMIEATAMHNILDTELAILPN